MTQWRPVPGFEGRYEVSDDGRVASLPTRTWPTRRILAVVLAKRGGYPSVVLRANGKQYARKVHRLVCEAFNGAPPPNRVVVRHLDGDKTNNTPGNLAWGTHSENSADTVAHGNHPGANKDFCKFGHALSGENLYVNKSSGARQCRTCQSDAKRKYREKRRATANV